MVLAQSIAAAALAAAAGLGALGPVELPDQRGGRDSLDAHRGHPVVVVIVDARRLGSVRRWEKDLATRFPALHLLTVADVNETRPTTLERVSEVLARRVPPEVAVLIDMERRWARTLELDTAVPNLLLVDASGNLVTQYRGRYGAELAAEVGARVAALEGGT